VANNIFLVLDLHCYHWSSFHNHESYLHRVFPFFLLIICFHFFFGLCLFVLSFVLYFWWMGFYPWFLIQCFPFKVLVFFTWKQKQFVHTLKSSIKQVKHKMRTLGLGEIDDVTKKSRWGHKKRKCKMKHNFLLKPILDFVFCVVWRPIVWRLLLCMDDV